MFSVAIGMIKIAPTANNVGRVQDKSHRVLVCNAESANIRTQIASISGQNCKHSTPIANMRVQIANIGAQIVNIRGRIMFAPGRIMFVPGVDHAAISPVNRRRAGEFAK
jgi:hypothetical protein